MDFSDALHSLKRGLKVSRSGWNGKGQWVGLQEPDSGSMNTLPYAYIRTVTGDRVPWICSQTDMLADDWEVVT